MSSQGDLPPNSGAIVRPQDDISFLGSGIPVSKPLFDIRHWNPGWGVDPTS